jgi:hypothetical protein
MLQALHAGWHYFCNHYTGLVFATLGILLAASTGILFGLGAMLYLAYMTQQRDQAPLLSKLAIIQQLQGAYRLATMFWLGIAIWAIIVFPTFQSPFLGVPLSWLIIQPLWLALMMSFRYDLSLVTALKSVWHLTIAYPRVAIQLYLLGLLAFVGPFGLGLWNVFAFSQSNAYPIIGVFPFLALSILLLWRFSGVWGKDVQKVILTLFCLLFGFGSFLTFPIAIGAMLHIMKEAHLSCAAAIQRTYIQ